MDLFDGPLTADIDPRIAQGLRGVVEALGAADNGLRRLREGAAVAETAMTGVANRAGSAAATLSQAADSFRGSANRFGREAAEGFRGLTEMAHHVEAFAGGVTRLAAEQQRLDRINRETGLNLERIAASSERYMSQLDAAKVVEQFAAARMNLSQVEAEALAQGAARLAQMFDTSVEEQGRRLFSAISRGEIEVLQTLGPHMAALSGQTHTASERLTTFIDHLGELGPATEDAATRMERLEGAVQGLERSFSGGFVDEAQRLFAGIGTADDDMVHLAAGVRQLGTDAADLASAIVNLAMVPVLAIGTLVSALSDTLGDLIRAADALSRRDFAGARAAIGADLGQDTQDLFETMMGRLRAGGQSSARLLGIDTGEDGPAPEEHHDGSAAAGVMLFGVGSQPDGRRGRGGRGGHRRPTIDQLMGRAFQNEDASRRVNRTFGLHIEQPSLEVEDQFGARRSIRDMEGEGAGKDAERARREQELFDQGEAGKATAAREETEARRNARLGRRLEASTGADVGDVGLDAEARAANDIASAWGNATDALTKHLDLVAQGRETWADVWTGIKETAQRALIDIAMTEGKVELGRALGALAVGNFAGAGLHLAAGAALLAIGGGVSYLTGGAGDADKAREKEAEKEARKSRSSSRVPRMDASASGGSSPVTISVNFGGSSFYGSGGPRQAAAEFVDLLNRNAHLSGAVLDARVVGR
jgi:hypothetical protein